MTPGTHASIPLDEVALNHDFARAVLEGIGRGRLWVDDRSLPGAAHVLHQYGMSLVWGRELGRALPPLIDHLCRGEYREKDEWLQIDPRWAGHDWDAALSAAPGMQRFTRVNFRFERPAFPALSAVPAGWSLRAMSSQEFDLPDVSVTPCAYWHSAAQFLACGGGVCAAKEGEVGAIAFAVTRFGTRLEIGIETRAAFRGQGLARAVAAAMVERCLAGELEPVWSCRKENTASSRLAKRLGFAVVRELPYYRLPRASSN